MAKITYVEFGGEKKHTIEVESGSSVMEGAIDNGVPGIEALCGGSCSCSTCHVYVDQEWIGKLPPPEDLEQEVLEYAEEVRPASRLSCQIEVSDELDGLIVHMPETQAV